jgi:hypothetical protein
MIDIDEERVGKAMRYLAETDLPYAEAKAALESSEILRKRVRARVFLTEDGTVAERQAEAETHHDTEAADDQYVNAIKAFEELKARRQRAELLIDVWRSLEATRRKAA